MKMANENNNTKKEPTKKGFELDNRIIEVIQDEFSDFAKYLPTPQDRAMYFRKCKEYWEKINARLLEMEI